MSQPSQTSTVDFGSDNTDPLEEDPDLAAGNSTPLLSSPPFDVFGPGAWHSAVEVPDETVNQADIVQQCLDETEEAANFLSQEENTPNEAPQLKPTIRRPWEDSPYDTPRAVHPYQESYVTPLTFAPSGSQLGPGSVALEPWPFSVPTMVYEPPMMYPNTGPEEGTSTHVGFSSHQANFSAYPGFASSLYSGPEANLLGATRTTVRTTKKTDAGSSYGNSREIASMAVRNDQPAHGTPELYQLQIPQEDLAYQLPHHSGQFAWGQQSAEFTDQVSSSLSQDDEEPLELRTSEAYLSPCASQNYSTTFDSLTSSAASALPPYFNMEATELGHFDSPPFPSSLQHNPQDDSAHLPSVAQRSSRKRTAAPKATSSPYAEQYSAREEPKHTEQADEEAAFKVPRKTSGVRSPRLYLFSQLQIGSLVIDASNEHNSDVKKLYRLKIMFSSRKLMYEFESKHLSGVAASLKDAEPLARIDVPFGSVQSVKQQGDQITIKTFDTMPLNTYLGHHEKNQITYFPKYKNQPAELSSRLASYHKVTFEPGQADKFKSDYEEAQTRQKTSRSSTNTSRSSRSRPSTTEEPAGASTSSKRVSRKRSVSASKATENPVEKEEKPANKRQKSTRK